ncbi:hypothetical protein F4777DRAFT_128988 [Nemania sp. FL0916]|nr:hypothetical protein F4777DRAFT_128988 [Nemania sp. FL0916]
MDEASLGHEFPLEEPLQAGLPEFLMSDADNLASESIPNVVVSDHAAEGSETHTSRRYLSKRPHRKSRAGCKQCKRRRVKCDEAKPTCKACTLRSEPCIYPNTPSLQPSATSPGPSRQDSVPPTARSREQSAESSFELDDNNLDSGLTTVLAEPVFIPEQAVDLVDMKMLWFYNTYSFQSFSINAGRSPVIDYTLKVKVVEHAFRSPFMMHTLKALSALHLRTLNQPVPNHKVIEYQANAFEGYRNAIQLADPKDFPALLACSLFIIATSSQTFRDPNGKRLFIVDWISLWRGIGIIIEIVTPQAVHESGLSSIFYRPPISMDKSTKFIPNNLLFMVTSIKPGDTDFDYQTEYYELLKYLGSLYMELIEHGFGPVFNLRIITFFSFCPRPLLPLAKRLQPRMLIIIAYWICFVKLLRNGTWWMRGIPPQAYQIFEEVGEEWDHLLHVPKMIMETDDSVEIARLLIDNRNWTPGELDLYHKHRDPRAKSELKLISNDGSEVEITDGQWRVKATGDKWAGPRVIVDPKARSGDPLSEELLLGTNLLYNTMPLALRPTAPVESPADSSASTPALSPSTSPSP